MPLAFEIIYIYDQRAPLTDVCPTNVDYIEELK